MLVDAEDDGGCLVEPALSIHAISKWIERTNDLDQTGIEMSSYVFSKLTKGKFERLQFITK